MKKLMPLSAKPGKVYRIGNSARITVPAVFFTAAGIDINADLEVQTYLDDGKLVAVFGEAGSLQQAQPVV